ncbi:MAG: acyl-CoA dehydratase activase-related protein, partial [Nanoarchaeota archaeon]|nr:acyl-CoA dehydratase activase-related protein [Nanoarchaeota archaeon]
PFLPGHRACIGLIKSIKDKTIKNTHCELSKFIDLKFEKRIIECRGVACGDKDACCSRTLLTSVDEKNKISLLLGGCTAVNEFAAGKKTDSNATDSYKNIWEFINNKLPKSTLDNRLIIPRSFAVSEQAYFLSKVFENLNIPVHVDSVTEQDILEAQPLFDIDVCAPLIGATGQFIRLAQEKHGVILAPQIDFLPTEETSLGRTCTTNQGGMVIAKNFAKTRNPKCNIELFDLSIKKFDSVSLASQFINKLKNVFTFYEIEITEEKLVNAIQGAIDANILLKREIAEETRDIIKEAIKEKRSIVIVCGREYILNPGIYDSHVGKLLKDKGIIAIPSYVLETELDGDFNYIYWKNPHDIITKINSVANHRLYKYLKNKDLKELIKKIEQGETNSSLSTMQVSTFRCGPDTVTSPTIDKITQKMPNLFIQSDAMIKELAHLENRVNTYINQLKKDLHKDFSGESFDIKLIEQFDAKNLNKEKDVVYFPTLHDNRTVTSAFRATGMTIIDNYADETYNLEKKVRLGRKYAGDSVCAPLAGVFADMLLAVEDFKKRKREGDPLTKGKERILIFDNKGTGPCRQGQYYEMHKMLLGQQFGCKGCAKKKNDKVNNQIGLLVGHEKDGFNIGVDEWAFIQSFQGGVMQGVLHSILLKYGSNCKDYNQYQEFYKDYLELKKEIFRMQENDTKPSDKTLKIIEKVNKISPYLGIVFKYFGYGLYKNNGLRKKLINFTDKWGKNQTENQDKKIKIHLQCEF